MRSLLEIKLIWLFIATYLIIQDSVLLTGFVSVQLLLFTIMSRPLQKVTVIGAISLIAFALLFALIDLIYGGFNPVRLINWSLLGLCYIILYEFIALYELSQFLKDYRIPLVVIIIINFGLRFLPIFFDTINDAYLGYKSKSMAKENIFIIAARVAPSILIILLNKFEQFWISYNIRFNDNKPFNIKIKRKDYIVMTTVLLNFVLLIFVKMKYV
jgi:hypothetical protein